METKRVIVALDEPEHVEGLMVLACGIADNMKAEVEALHVVEIGSALPLDAEDPAIDRPAEALLNLAADAAAAKCGRSVQRRLVRAREPGPAIVQEAAAAGVELLILGYHLHKSRLSMRLIGSVADYVAEHAPCRVIIHVLPASDARAVAA